MENLHYLRQLKRCVCVCVCVSMYVHTLTHAHTHRLDLGFNAIRVIKGLQDMKQLIHLELNNNLIADLKESVHTLAKVQPHTHTHTHNTHTHAHTHTQSTPNLQVLLLHGNDMCAHTDYRMCVVHALTDLYTLDYTYVTDDERVCVCVCVCVNAHSPIRTLIDSTHTHTYIHTYTHTESSNQWSHCCYNTIIDTRTRFCG